MARYTLDRVQQKRLDGGLNDGQIKQIAKVLRAGVMPSSRVLDPTDSYRWLLEGVTTYHDSPDGRRYDVVVGSGLGKYLKKGGITLS